MNNSRNQVGLNDVNNLLFKSLQNLIKSGMSNGHWGSVRATADSLIAMNRCLKEEPSPYPILKKHAYKYIVKRASKPDKSINNACDWEEEVWDSSVAIMALSHKSMHKRYRDNILSGWAGLENKYNKINHNWHDEPWETSWALLALHSIMENEELETETVNWKQCLLWLSDLCGKPKKGLLINWHYSALFVLIVNRYANDKYLGGLENEDLKMKLRNGRNEIISHIMDNLKNTEDEDILWTQELWSNSLILWALCEPYQDKYEEVHVNSIEIDRVYKWFIKVLDKNKQQREDIAFSCISLCALWNSLSINENKTYEKLRHEIKSNIAIKIEQLTAIERLIDKIKKNDEEDKKKFLGRELLKEIKSDYTPKPPLLEKDHHPGYHTVNLRENVTVISLIIITVIIFTFLTFGIQPYVNDKLGKVLVRLPVVLGVFATVLKLANVSPSAFLRFKSKKQTNDD